MKPSSPSSRHRPLRFAALLLTLAAAPLAASAQSSLTVYGIADVFVEWADGGNGGITRVESGGIAQSRLGFLGSEDLGGGLKAQFNLESGFAFDTGQTGSSFWSRQAWVGLASRDWGAIKLGHQYTPLFLTTFAFDTFGLGNAGNFWNLSGYGNFWQHNSVVWESPRWGGLALRALWAPGEQSGSREGRYAALSFDYTADRLNLVASYDQRGVSARGSLARYVAVGGSYDFGGAKLFAGWQSVRHADPVEPANADARIASIGVHVPVSAVGRVAASVTVRQDRAADDRDARQIAIGYFHALSKRTTLYGVVGQIANDDQAAFGIGYTPIAVRTGHDVHAVQAGIQHLF